MKQKKPPQMSTSTSSALPLSIRRERWTAGATTSPSKHPPSPRRGRTCCACVLRRGVTRGRTRPRVASRWAELQEGELPAGSAGFFMPYIVKVAVVFLCPLYALSLMTPLTREAICSWKMYVKLTCFGSSERPAPVPVFVFCKEMVKEILCAAR